MSCVLFCREPPGGWNVMYNQLLVTDNVDSWLCTGLKRKLVSRSKVLCMNLSSLSKPNHLLTWTFWLLIRCSPVSISVSLTCYPWPVDAALRTLWLHQCWSDAFAVYMNWDGSDQACAKTSVLCCGIVRFHDSYHTSSLPATNFNTFCVLLLLDNL